MATRQSLAVQRTGVAAVVVILGTVAIGQLRVEILRVVKFPLRDG